MADAKLEVATADVTAAEALFRARGRRVVFPGFFRAYVEGTDDPEAAIEDRDAPLPELTQGEELDLAGLEAVGHETKPPARFTEAALVKALEAAGVGRPSTYASIISTIQDRGYARKDAGALVPTFTAFAVHGLLAADFQHLVDLGFTAEMEADLDRIAAGEADWQAYLRRFYEGDDGLAAQIEQALEAVDARTASTVELDGVTVRVGRYGPFIEHQHEGERVIVPLPEDLAPGDLKPDVARALIERTVEGPQSLGDDPDTGQPVYLKEGPYGPYVQLGDGEEGSKPKRVSLPKNLAPGDVTLPIAVELLGLPRTLGDHPETGKSVRAGIGRYGPYVVHDGTFASLRKEDDVLRVDLDRGLELLAAKAARGSRGRSTANVLKELGEHPETGDPVNVLDGRYGPYVKHGRDNASLPKGTEPATVTLEQALGLLAEKAAKPKRGKRTKG